jgi:hypothetical protein
MEQRVCDGQRMSPDIQSVLNRINELHPPFWKDLGFWISLAVGIAALVFAILAWVEARQAKRAATAAGRTVKIQTVAIELTDIAQKLDRIQPEILFNEARDLLTEIQRRLRRLMSPFAKDPELSEAIRAVLEAFEAAQTSLNAVRPTDPKKEAEAPNAVYYGIEGDFATISNRIADLTGLFEAQTFDFGDDHAGS